MLSLAFNGFGLAKAAELALEQNKESSVWKTIKYQFSHVDWVGFGYWDLIQPSFMFMVGVSMAYSYVKRQQRGDSWLSMFAHAGIRAVILILLGIFLISNGKKTTEWSFMNVLTQIGLGYLFLFMLWGRKWWIQLATTLAILVLTSLAYWQAGGDGIDIENGSTSVGVDAAWAQQHLVGVPTAWHKNANLGHQVDLNILNLLPRKDPFTHNAGGYQTINFIPSLATMILGLMMGELLRSPQSDRFKLGLMLASAVAAIAAGLLWSQLGCPIIKRLWTPSWALVSGGICIGILGTFYYVLDHLKWRWGSIVLTVFGVNSIAIYVMYMLLRPWTEATLQIHFGTEIFSSAGEIYKPILQSTMVGLCFWLACYWMYRNKIFIRI